MPRPPIYCKDGFAMSVQDHEYAYATPGQTSEIGYPTKEEPLLEGYAEDPSDPTDTIYANVPNEIVEEIKNKRYAILYASKYIQYFIYTCMILAMMLFGQFGTRKFIYFQF